MNANTTTFIVAGFDYFVANLDNGGVRIGLIGGDCFSFDSRHANYARCVAVRDEFQAEALFDEIYAEHHSK